MNLFAEGFDRYGAPGGVLAENLFGSNPVLLTGGAALTQGRWTEWGQRSLIYSANFIASLVAGRYQPAGVPSAALRIDLTSWSGLGGGSFVCLRRTLSANYTRLILGLGLRSPLTMPAGIMFWDGSVAQLTLALLQDGRFALYQGDFFGTLLATSAAAVAANSWHEIEIDVTFNASTGAAMVVLDGETTIISLSGANTAPSGANQATGFSPASAVVAGVFTGHAYADFDDLYVNDATGSYNNAMEGVCRVETQLPVGDASVEWTAGPAAFGAYATAIAANSTPGAGTLILRRFVAPWNGTLSAVNVAVWTNSATANFRPVIFADSAGAAGSLLKTGSTVTGCTAGTELALPLSTGLAITEGTAYWIGLMMDSAIALQLADGGVEGWQASEAFSGGAPNPAPAMTGNESSWQLWATAAVSTDFSEVDNNPSDPDFYISSTSAAEDLYNFPPLSTPATILAVQVTATARKTLPSSSVINLKTKSGSSETAGNAANIPLPDSFGDCTSTWETDPATSLPWTKIGLDAATSGQAV